MKLKTLLALGIVSSLAIGFAGGYFLSGYLTNAMISDEAKSYAARVKVNVVDNGLNFIFSPDSHNVKVLFWQTGGKLLSLNDVWVDGKWQLDLGGEDKPTTDYSGDKCDIVLKIMMLATGNVQFEVFCGGDYVKRIYFDNVLKLDTSTGSRYAHW